MTKKHWGNLKNDDNPGLQDPEIVMIEGCDDVCSYRMFGTSKHTDSYMRNNNLRGRLRIAKFAILVAGSTEKRPVHQATAQKNCPRKNTVRGRTNSFISFVPDGIVLFWRDTNNL